MVTRISPPRKRGRQPARDAVGVCGREDGRSECCSVMEWIGLMAWPETALMSTWCLVARELDEPVRGRKANDGRATCWCAFGCSEQGNSPPRQSTGCRCVSRRWGVAGVQWSAGLGNCGGGSPGVSSLTKCSSRVRGNLHARFLGGGGRVTVSCYPARRGRVRGETSMPSKAYCVALHGRVLLL